MGVLAAIAGFCLGWIISEALAEAYDAFMEWRLTQ
jgi:hypothetical protein